MKFFVNITDNDSFAGLIWLLVRKSIQLQKIELE